jgi:DNA-binding beta-propeller fold protein YncE
MAPKVIAVVRTTAAIAIIVLLTVATAGYVFLVPRQGAKSTTFTLAVSTSTAVSTGPIPSVSSFEVANVTVTRNPYFWPQGIAVDANTSMIYIPDGTDNVTVVNASTYGVVGTITLPGSPTSGIVVNPETNMIYVAASGCTNEVNVSKSCQGYKVWPSAGIVEIDGENDSIVGGIPISVDHLAVDPTTGVLYGAIGEYLLSIDAQSGSLIANTSLGAEITNIAVDVKTNLVYASTCKILSLGCDGPEFFGIDGSSHQVQFSIPRDFENIAVNPSTNAIYAVAIERNLTFLSINGGSGVTRYSSSIAACGLGAGGITLALDAATNQVYVTASGYLLTIDASNGQAVNMLSAPGALHVAVSPDGADAYLAMEAASEKFGYLFVLPSATGESYVNSSALQPGGGCAP